MKQVHTITILGAGLVGSLLAVFFRQKGYEVNVFERRPDMRKTTISAGRSINFAMSERGWKALSIVGMEEEIRAMTIPMPGRYLHQEDGSHQFQAYGKQGESIYSISRAGINMALMNKAEELGAQFHFDHRAQKVDLESKSIVFDENSKTAQHDYELLFGADGAHSVLRTAITYQDRTNFEQHYLEHGYKELNIPAGNTADNKWQIEKNALHIWPRRNHMMIALPNLDGSFTCTLFFPFEGTPSFESLHSDEELLIFFKEHFPDAVPFMPTLLEDFNNNPTSSLITTKVFPWVYKGEAALIGDAAHAVVPFYGQGLNAGFQDVTILNDLLEQNHNADWATILEQYQSHRKENSDALAELAYLNFIEMRDLVADESFLLRKKIEQDLGRRFPGVFNSVYEMVSFTHTPYRVALENMKLQDRLLKKIMDHSDYFQSVEDDTYYRLLEEWIQEYRKEDLALRESN